ELPFPAETFDLVIAAGVLPWLEFPELGLLEIARVLSPAGRAILTTDNKWSFTTLLDPLCSPVTRPARRLARRLLQRMKLLPYSQKPTLQFHSIRRMNTLLLRAGLERTLGMTIGFGPV